MQTKTQKTDNIGRSLVLYVIDCSVFGIIYKFVFLKLYGSDGFGTLKALLCTLLLSLLLELAKKTWRSYFAGTVYGNVILKSDSMQTIPIKNVEISWGPHHHRKKQNTPVSTNAKGEFYFDDLPLKPNLTLSVKLPNNRYVHNVIGEIEGVRWLFGLHWLELPISSGDPKRIDFIVAPDAESDEDDKTDEE